MNFKIVDGLLVVSEEQIAEAALRYAPASKAPEARPLSDKHKAQLKKIREIIQDVENGKLKIDPEKVEDFLEKQLDQWNKQQKFDAFYDDKDHDGQHSMKAKVHEFLDKADKDQLAAIHNHCMSTAGKK